MEISPGIWYGCGMPKPPEVIDATYTVTAVNGRPVRQPIFNNWRYAMPLVGLVGLRLLWLLATGH